MVPTLTRNYIWDMGGVIRCWQGIANRTITLTDYTYEVSGIHFAIQESGA